VHSVLDAGEAISKVSQQLLQTSIYAQLSCLHCFTDRKKFALK